MSIGQDTRAWMRQALIDFENADRFLEEGPRLRTGLANIKAFAAALQPKLNGMEVKIGGIDMSAFLSALRDYAGEVLDGTQVKGRMRTVGTDIVSAAQRWGVDFTAPPTK